MTDIIIRNPRAEELPVCVDISFKAFNRTDLNNREITRRIWSQAIEFESMELLVAEKNKTIVGIGGLIYHIGLVWIGYMSTIPHLQRQGIGQTLFRSLLERSRELDYQTIALFASKKGEPLYQKFGFTGLFYATRCSIEVDNPPNITMDIVQHSSIPEWIYRLDYEINGFDRRKFLDFIISLGSKVLILEDEGYCFITGSLIGPIIAQNTDQALALVARAGQLGGKRIIIPEKKIKAFKSNFSLQIEENGRCRYMMLGKHLTANLDKIFSYYSFGTG